VVDPAFVALGGDVELVDVEAVVGLPEVVVGLPEVVVEPLEAVAVAELLDPDGVFEAGAT